MNEKALLKIGIIGAIVTAVCCFTPLLVLVLGALGLSAVLGWLDYVLFPTLLVFIAVIIYAVWKRRAA